MTESLMLLLPLGLMLLGVALGFLCWGIFSGQYDNINQTHALMALDEQDKPSE